MLSFSCPPSCRRHFEGSRQCWPSSCDGTNLLVDFSCPVGQKARRGENSFGPVKDWNGEKPSQERLKGRLT